MAKLVAVIADTTIEWGLRDMLPMKWKVLDYLDKFINDELSRA